MASISQTLADGSPIPRYDTQSPKSQFTVGKIQTLGNIIWGYSGLVSFDITAATTYPLLRFTLEKNAMVRTTFNADWAVLDITNNDAGISIAIDGTIIIRADSQGAGQREPPAMGAWSSEFFVPAGRDCNILLLNTSAGTDLLQANVVLVGQYV
jgi:hypothetical protein